MHSIATEKVLHVSHVEPHFMAKFLDAFLGGQPLALKTGGGPWYLKETTDFELLPEENKIVIHGAGDFDLYSEVFMKATVKLTLRNPIHKGTIVLIH